jgi:tetratricopeptide (TPR) repeat protein
MTDAAMKSEIFAKFFILKRDLANYDTLIMETIHPRPKKEDSASVARRDSVHRSDSLAAAKNPLRADRAFNARRDTSGVHADTSAVRADAGRAPKALQADSSRPTASAVGFTTARKDSLTRADSLGAASAKRQRIDSLAHLVARTKFELAGLLYLEMARSDSALVYYSDVCSLTNDSSLAARSYFTMAEILTSRDSLSKPATDSIYRKIIDIAPQSSYAQEARKTLGLPLLREEKDSAETLYWSAERLIDGGKPKEAIRQLRTLAVAYPKSPYSPKALYTVGWLYENTLIVNDSAEIAYKELVDKFPGSTYAGTVKPKLAEITAARLEAEQKAKAEKDAADKIDAEKARAKAEKAAQAKADADKLKALQPGKTAAPAGRDSAGVPLSSDSAGVRSMHLSPPALPDSAGVRSMHVSPPALPDSAGVQPMHVSPPALPDSAGVRSMHLSPPVNSGVDSTSKQPVMPADSAQKSQIHPLE